MSRVDLSRIEACRVAALFVESHQYVEFTQSQEHPALHQKSGQYADPSVNKTFLASF
jgi:hypothetical protein